MATVLFAGCSSQNSEDNNSADVKMEAEAEGLSDFEMLNGIGPVTEEISINEVDPDLADKGAGIFEMNCSACHKMNDRYVGPPLGGVANTRTPAFIMNMILNPEEMIDEHPLVQALMKEYLTPMPNQNLSREEARAVVEYLAAEVE